MKSIMHMTLTIATVMVTLFSRSAFAADPAPGAACAVADAVVRSGGPTNSGVIHEMVCQGSVWVVRLTYAASNNVGIGTTNPASKLEVRGEIRTTDSTGTNRFYGHGRPGVVRYGTTGAETGLCTNGGTTFGLSRGTSEWSSAAAACPSGTWVCTSTERGTGACNTARPDGGTDGYQGDGTAVNFGSTAHVGWTADWDAAATTLGTTVDEAGTVTSYPEPRSYPVWCCN